MAVCLPALMRSASTSSQWTWTHAWDSIFAVKVNSYIGTDVVAGQKGSYAHVGIHAILKLQIVPLDDLSCYIIRRLSFSIFLFPDC